MNERQCQAALEQLRRRTDPRLWEHWCGASNMAMQMPIPEGARLHDGGQVGGLQMSGYACSDVPAPGYVFVGSPERLLRLVETAYSAARKLTVAYRLARRTQLEYSLQATLPAGVARWLATHLPWWVVARLLE